MIKIHLEFYEMREKKPEPGVTLILDTGGKDELELGYLNEDTLMIHTATECLYQFDIVRR